MSFIERHKKSIDSEGFWMEENRLMTLRAFEMQYKTEIIKKYFIEDFVINGNKTLIKWKKRLHPLSKQELKDKYGR